MTGRTKRGVKVKMCLNHTMRFECYRPIKWPLSGVITTIVILQMGQDGPTPPTSMS